MIINNEIQMIIQIHMLPIRTLHKKKQKLLILPKSYFKLLYFTLNPIGNPSSYLSLGFIYKLGKLSITLKIFITFIYNIF